MTRGTRRAQRHLEALVAAMRRAGVDSVDASPRRLAEYSTDASNYRIAPRAVVYPRDGDQVAAALAVATAHGVPVTARGGGTSTAGNSVGAGVVLDFSRYFNRVVAVDPDARTATVQPGAVLDAINTAATPYGLRFGPDPSTHSRATIGGSIGNNACGARALRYGRTADNVVALDILTADGERLAARRFGRDGLTDAGRIGADLDKLVQRELATVRTEFGRFTRQISGYPLEHLLPENGADLAKFLVGTEGTLAVVVGATVQLVPSPPAVALAVLGYPDMATAADDVPALLPHSPVALEGMDARLVDVVRRRGVAAVDTLPPGGGWLLVEVAGADERDATAAAARLAADATCLGSLVLTGAAARHLWRIREDGAGLGGRTPAGQPAWPGWEDAAVPPERLGDYLRDFQALMSQHDLDGLVYGHFGDGCVHARIDFPLAGAPQRFRRFLVDAATLVAGYGGSLSGEHGDGRARGELLPTMYSPAALRTFAAVKHIFDPGNLLNPGVLVDPEPVDAHLRLAGLRPRTTGLGFAYPHDGGDFAAAVHRCTGVGKCRADNTAADGVMCPSYLATRDERDSTRGRSRVLQEMIRGALPDGVRGGEVLDSLDLCLACKGCSSDCPAGVDMATYKSEVLHQHYRRRLRPRAHYALGRLPLWLRQASPLAGLVNRLTGSPALSGAAKYLAGVDRRRPLPRLARPTFRAWYARHTPPARTPSEGTPVMLWVDTFTNYLAPQVGIAAVEVLEAAGYQVRIPSSTVCCGLTWITTGQLDGARRQLRRTLGALAPALADGVPVVGLEPSCTAVLRRDAAELLPDDPRAAAVVRATRTLAELLAATPTWTPPNLDGVHAVAQVHCHQHAVMGWSADRALLTGAGASVDTVGGCCGLAGNFGVERGHYEVSTAVAEQSLLPALRRAPDAAVLADGFSCRTQLEHLGGGTRGAHLAELLAAHLPTPQRG